VLSERAAYGNNWCVEIGGNIEKGVGNRRITRKKYKGKKTKKKIFGDKNDGKNEI
jgi:hypothetical protein